MNEYNLHFDKSKIPPKRSYQKYGVWDGNEILNFHDANSMEIFMLPGFAEKDGKYFPAVWTRYITDERVHVYEVECETMLRAYWWAVEIARQELERTKRTLENFIERTIEQIQGESKRANRTLNLRATGTTVEERTQSVPTKETAGI